MKKQLKGIVAFSIQIDRLEGNYKMRQNRAPEDALAAASGVRSTRNMHAEMVANEMEARDQKGCGGYFLVSSIRLDYLSG